MKKFSFENNNSNNNKNIEKLNSKTKRKSKKEKGTRKRKKIVDHIFYLQAELRQSQIGLLSLKEKKKSLKIKWMQSV